MSRKAILYRMVTDQHICPFGLKSKDLLTRKGYTVEDHPLVSREEVDAFKEKHDVKTAPQTFIDGQRIGGYDDLRRFFGLSVPNPDKKTYKPVIAIFATTFLTAIALSIGLLGGIQLGAVIGWFIAFSMIVLAIQKLRDLDSFSNQFLGYDLLAQRFVPYAFIYPFAEALAGIGMFLSFWQPLFGLIALFIGSIGAVSVYKAVYVDKRELKCACVGGNSNVPLGFVSMTENVMMVLMGLWMVFQ
jgi:glutaredoxin